MITTESLEENLPAGPSAIALGLFDGVHRGHQAVIGAAVAQRRAGLVPCVFTFTTIGGAPESKRDFSLLQTEAQKEKTLERLGVEWVITPDFSRFRGMSPQDFVTQVLVEKMNAKFIACGEDFHFGKDAAGSARDLQEICAPLGVEVQLVPPVLEKGEPISSTRIRRALREGEVEAVDRLLGRPFAIEGEVLHGRQLGRAMGCPTTNQRFPIGMTIPKFGVYAVVVTLPDGRRYTGAANVGVKPTVGSEEVLCETLLNGFSGDLYGQNLTVEFHRFIRGEQKFPSLEELFDTIRENARQAGEICREAL